MQPPGAQPPNATPLPNAALNMPDGAVVRLRVEYPTNPILQRVASVVVRAELPSTAPMASSLGSLVVRFAAPGCLVSPDEASIDLMRGTAAQFHVTPLASGPLPDAILDVSRTGPPLQRVGLRMTATKPGAWRGWLAATVAIPLLWWTLTGADAAAIGDAVAGRLPPGPWATSAGPAVRHLVEGLASAEQAFRLGFLFAAMLVVATVVTAANGRQRRRMLVGPSIALATGSASSTRNRGVPSYLTPVPPEELANVQL